ncbi:MAG: DUF3127 domain-containing protein [Paraprevotella sp.]|nr:DUF3127 domain-containing protein [Paraprevotella sp.]
MELIGKIIQVLPERGGTSARTGSEWRVGTYVLETTTDRYPRKMVFEVFGSDKIQQFNIQPGEMVRVSFDIDAREYQGRWYNSIRAWNVDRNVAAPMGQAPAGAPDMTPFGVTAASVAPSEPVPFASGGADDLPF